MTLRLSVLDQSPIRSGGTPKAALQETLALAVAAERWGYHRYWLAEHHNSYSFASASPEVLLARVASLTHSMRVGSGGVLLGHYSPLKIAENFRLLEELFPGRIDLGIGRASGSDPLTARILQYGGAIPEGGFGEQVGLLLSLLQGPLTASGPAQVMAMPTGSSVPPLWLLGSSQTSAALAAQLGCRFSSAHFINDAGGEDAMRKYRSAFRPSSSLLAEPDASLAIFVICADTDTRAKELAESRDLWRLLLGKGVRGPIPSVEEARRYPYSGQDHAVIAHNRRRQFVGTPEQLRPRLTELADRYAVSELMVVSICFDFEDRKRSYELLAQAFELPPRER